MRDFQIVLLWGALVLVLAASLYAVIQGAQSRSKLNDLVKDNRITAANAQQGVCILKTSAGSHLKTNEKLLKQTPTAGTTRAIILSSIAVEKQNIAALKNIQGCNLAITK